MAQFDPSAATAAYLAQVPAEAHAKAQAYTQGGHWLLLWGFLVSVAVAWLILRSGVLVRLRDRLERRRPRPLLVSLVLGLVFTALAWAIALPWSAYSAWWREKAYGLNNQTFGAWLGEAAVGAVLTAVGAAIFYVAFYAIIRRAPRLWWAGSAGLATLFIVLIGVIAPVFIAPLFNDYQPAPPGPVRDAVVRLAQETGTPSDKLFVYDGSKQSSRYTANVNGLFGTAQINMSDAMLQRATLPEVRGVVGHEIGHYQEAHILWQAAALTFLAALAFWLVYRSFPHVARAMRAGNVQGVADPAGLPVLSVILAVLGLLGTPVLNSMTRIGEERADIYSLRHAREPDGLAAALVKTIEYRAASPGAIEELIFYSHPSVERRVRRAMEWKLRNDPRLTPPDE
jgi:STE24 endopeptidase